MSTHLFGDSLETARENGLHVAYCPALFFFSPGGGASFSPFSLPLGELQNNEKEFYI